MHALEEELRTILNSPDCEAGLADLLCRFRKFDELREAGPLLILPITNAWNDHQLPVQELLEKLLLEISLICKHHESYTFFLEAWVEHKVTGLRSIVLCCLTNILSKAKKGPIANKKTQFMTQMCSLLLNNYFRVTEDLEHDGSVDLIPSVQYFLDQITQQDVFAEESTMNDMAAICRKDLLATVYLRVERFMMMGDSTGARSLSLKLPFTGSHLIVDTWNLIHARAKALKSKESENSSYFDLQDADIAWWISSIADRKGFPFPWSRNFRLLLLMKAARFHAREEMNATRAVKDFKLAGEMLVGLPCSEGTGNFSCSHVDLAVNHLEIDFLSQAVDALAAMVSLATTAPPHDGPLGDQRKGLSMTNRQQVYVTYSSIIRSLSLDDCMDYTWKFLCDSRNDSAIGIFTKVAKDRWAAEAGRESEYAQGIFLKIAKNIIASEFSVLDGLDSLFSVLNWIRFVALSSESFTKKHKEFFRDQISILSRKVDAELAGVRGSSSSESEMREMQVISVSDLLRRVSEILDVL